MWRKNENVNIDINYINYIKFVGNFSIIFRNIVKYEVFFKQIHIYKL